MLKMQYCYNYLWFLIIVIVFIFYFLSVKGVEFEREYGKVMGVSLSKMIINTCTLQHKLLDWGKVGPLW